MSFIKVNQNLNFYNFTENGQYMCVILMLFDNNNT